MAKPTAIGGTMTSVQAVGTVSAPPVTFHRLYLPDGGFFQLHLDAEGQPDECRYFSVFDNITPGNEEDWRFWLDRAEGLIGWPEFQTKDGKSYGRRWNAGPARIAPRRLDERIETARNELSSVAQAMLYAAPIGAPPPAPSDEYILVEAIEQQGQAWVRISAGLDINPASLSLA